MIAALIIFSGVLLYAPLVLSVVRMVTGKWRHVYALAILASVPHLTLLISFFFAVPFFKGNGAGWDQMIWYFETLLILLVANGLFWIGSKQRANQDKSKEYR
ncbi:MAG: hypothetical protein GY947_20360 [Rhodobacteraceae bacterium]|nr:hypothetical protein [Paracoccaceae bacterium]